MTKPTSYDEITRRTVPEPDSSFRPSPEQVRQAYAGFRALDADEQALSDRAHAALAASGISGVQVEVTGTQITLRGSVPDAAALARVRGLVEAVGSVDDQLVIAG